MEYTSVYGYIKIDRAYQKSVDFIKSLVKEDDGYPFINANMFSFGDYKIPYYYENIMFGFAATYKYFGLELEDWNTFIVKMEHILRNVDFENAQFHVESALGDYTLFWMKREWAHLEEEGEKKYVEEYNLTKTNEWYFGFGKRSTFTGYIKKLDPQEDLRNLWGGGFIYPVPLDSNL